MKSINVTSLFQTTLLCLTTALAAPALGEGSIAGSAHDFSDFSWSDGEICKPCHTPHHAIAGDLSGRLWNHTLSTATYLLHAGGNPDPKRAGGQEDMDRVSRLCLSCHDGTVALDSFGGKTDGTTLIGQVDSDAKLGTDLTNDHPVGVAVIFKEETNYGHYVYKPIASAKSAGLRFVKVDGTRTYTNQDGLETTADNEAVGCATCHDVHGNVPAGAFNLLRVPNDASGLCLTCHNK
jgi:predicted CXXCH cytochrome family protein